MTKWFQLARHNPNWGVLFIALVTGNALAENSRISYPPVPDWVRQVEWVAGTSWSSNSNSAGTRYLLYESQERPKKAEEFVRVIELMENESGVQDSGSLRFSFDPEFQELCLHQVVVHRDGKAIACLNPSKVRIIQPEPDLDGHVFTGRQTAVLFVEDLRVGDVLEYAYTIRGANPILGGHYSSRFIIQSESPVDRELFRVVWDDKTPLHQRLHLTDAQPVIKPWTDGMEYVWDFTNLSTITYEDYQPASCESYPYVEVSDFADWRSVVNWALPLYGASPTNLPSELRELVVRWQSSVQSNEEKARLALEFVQDNLRYTGIELGPDSYRPTDPVETFQKRFGDCKGKAVLLRFLLQQMNIESYPALVNSSIHEAIENRLPSPFAFNHVILQMRLDGKIVWVDPTCSHQGGSLWNRYLPPYGKALVIRPGNNALEDVPRSRPESAWQQKATSTFVIKGYELPVGFTVRTEYLGASADDMREEIAGTALNDLAQNYLNYYARLYSGITGGPPLKITDNRQANILAVEESYTITNLWTRDEAEKLWKACFYADNLYNTLTDPKTRLRKTPLALSYPKLRQQEVVVHLPDKEWQITDIETNIEHDAFSFNYHRKLHGSTVTFNYECRTRLATVPVALIPSYLTKRDHVEELLKDTLQRADGTNANRINWLMVVIAFFGAGAMTAAGVWYWRHMNASLKTAPPLLIENRQLQGLGGWLILVGFGLCLAPFVRIFTIGQSWEGFFSIQVWQTVAMPQGESYHPFNGPLLIFELLGNIFFFGLNLLVLCLFFTKRRAFPGLYIGFILCHAAFVILDDVGCALIPSLRSSASGKIHTEAIYATFDAIIWCLYMVKSRRVKATFVK
jgi:transglutaminase-like putative cysteine protease